MVIHKYIFSLLGTGIAVASGLGVWWFQNNNSTSLNGQGYSWESSVSLFNFPKSELDKGSANLSGIKGDFKNRLETYFGSNLISNINIQNRARIYLDVLNEYVVHLNSLISSTSDTSISPKKSDLRDDYEKLKKIYSEQSDLYNSQKYSEVEIKIKELLDLTSS